MRIEDGGCAEAKLEVWTGTQSAFSSGVLRAGRLEKRCASIRPQAPQGAKGVPGCVPSSSLSPGFSRVSVLPLSEDSPAAREEVGTLSRVTALPLGHTGGSVTGLWERPFRRGPCKEAAGGHPSPRARHLPAPAVTHWADVNAWGRIGRPAESP